VMPAGSGRTLLDFDPRPGGPGEVDVGDVRVPIGRVVAGVVRRADGSRIEAVRIQLKGANADAGRLRGGKPALERMGYGEEEETRADDRGRFAFVDLAPGAYGLEAWAPGMPSQSASVEVPADADPKPVEIVFPVGRTIRVVVVDESGKPVPWAYVNVEGGGGPHNTVSPVDAAGVATLVVTDSARSIRVYAWDSRAGDDRRFVDAYKTVAIEPQAREVRCVLHTGGVIRGRVVGPDGAPLPFVGVSLLSGDEVATTDYADAEGRFDVTARRGEEFGLALSGGRFEAQSIVPSPFAAEAAPVSADGPEVTLRATPVARDRRQEVLVLDPAGQPVRGARVAANWADRQGGESSPVETDASGRAELVELPSVLVHVHATPATDSGDLIKTSRALRSAGRGPVEIRLRRGLRVRGRVVGPAATAQADVVLTVRQGDSEHRQTLRPSERSFSLLLDPDDGAVDGVSAEASVGDLTYSAQHGGASPADGELVLTLEPAK